MSSEHRRDRRRDDRGDSCCKPRCGPIYQCKDGKDGKDGRDGRNGRNGFTGKQGPVGPAGPSGDLGVRYNSVDICNPTTLTGEEEILIRSPSSTQEFNFCRLSLSDLASVLVSIHAPKPTVCEAIEPKFGVRYRGFDASVGEKEVYLGKGYLHVGANRTQTDYDWQTSTTNLKSYPFSLEHDPNLNQISQTISGGSPPISSSVFSPVINMGDSVADTFQLTVANRQAEQPANIVQVNNLRLITTNGSYLILNPNTNTTIFNQAWAAQTIYQFTWPSDGTTPQEWFRFTGEILFKGTFGSHEGSKVELITVKCVNM